MGKTRRVPLEKGAVLELYCHDTNQNPYVQKVQIEEYIGEGASCLTYVVRLNKDGVNSSRMIMKELYPSCCSEGIQREAGRLIVGQNVKNSTVYRQKKEEFRQTFALQNRLADSDAMEIMVKPYNFSECGDTCYILGEMHLGEVLDGSKVSSLRDKLWIIYRTAEALQLLHEQGLLYMDLKPQNILWIRSAQAVRLFDVDSIIPYKDLSQVYEIHVTRPYLPPESEELEEWFDVNKSAFLRPSWDVYCLGLLFFELIFGRFPSKSDLKTGWGREGELERICAGQGCRDKNIVEKIRKILFRSLNKSFRVRYSSAMQMCEEVNEVKQCLDAERFVSKKEYAEANYQLEACHILDQWPVYQYAVKENGKWMLDMAFVGEHPMREAFVKMACSCVHIQNSELHIRIYAPDAADFLKKLNQENPAFARGIQIYREGKCIKDEIDRKLTGEPFAVFHLYNCSPQQLLDGYCDEWDRLSSRYLFLLTEDKETLCKLAVSAAGLSGKMWIGYLENGREVEWRPEKLFGNEMSDAAPGLNGNICMVPLSTRMQCEYYDEEWIHTCLYDRALRIHMSYYKGTHKNVLKGEARKSFEADPYNVQSSFRSALSIRYLLRSAGFTGEEKMVSELFRESVLSENEDAKRRFNELAALEHFCWTAYMALNGWDMPQVTEIEEYAFTDGNDFKNRERKLHPCMRESSPGNAVAGLKPKEWEWLSSFTDPAGENKESCRTVRFSEFAGNTDRAKYEAIYEGMDELDKMSLLLHRIAGEKSFEVKREIDFWMEELERDLKKAGCTEWMEDYHELVRAKEKLYSGESADGSEWDSVYLKLYGQCGKAPRFAKELLKDLEAAGYQMRIIKEYNACHDYKKSDGDIIRSIPEILSADISALG